MNINPAQLVNPGVFDYDKKRHEKMTRYKTAVKRAMFLNKDEKRNWVTLGYILSNKQLEEAEKLIINEDLKRLKRKQALERIKPKPKQKPSKR